MSNLAPKAKRRARIALIFALILLPLLALGAAAAWLLMPGDAYAPEIARLRMTPRGSRCEAVDLELDFLQKRAIARSWVRNHDRCESPLMSLPIEGARLESLRRSAGKAASTGLLRTLAMGQSYDGSMEIVTRRGDRERTWSYRGRKSEGVDELEAFHALVLQSGTRIRPEDLPAPASNPRSARIDLQDLIAPAAADAEKRAPGAWLSNVSVQLLRQGELPRVTPTPIILGFLSRTAGLSYVVSDGKVAFAATSPDTADRNFSTSRCKSRDMWKAAIASGMPDADGAELNFYVGGRRSGGFGPTWTLIPNGTTDRSHRRVFDGVTCGIVQP